MVKQQVKLYLLLTPPNKCCAAFELIISLQQGIGRVIWESAQGVILFFFLLTWWALAAKKNWKLWWVELREARSLNFWHILVEGDSLGSVRWMGTHSVSVVLRGRWRMWWSGWSRQSLGCILLSCEEKCYALADYLAKEGVGQHESLIPRLRIFSLVFFWWSCSDSLSVYFSSTV